MKKVLVGLSVAFQVSALTSLVFAADSKMSLVLEALGALSLLLSLVLGKASERKAEQKPVKETPVEQIRPNECASCSYFDQYIEYVKGKHGEGAAKRTREDVEDLLGNNKKAGRINELASERGANARVKGLVVGRVQSGKTQNFTGLITKAIDNGWRIILVLTSNNTALKDQTVARLEDDLQKSGLDYKKRDYELINGFCGQIPCVEPNGVTIGIALKEKNHLEGVSKWLAENAKALSSSGVLLIDDEADNATQNSSVAEDVWSDETVREYALELKRDTDWRNRRVGEWLENLVDGVVVCSFTVQERSMIEDDIGSRWLLKNDEYGVNVAQKIIKDYSETLHINESVSDTNCFSQPLSACVDNCFCGRAGNRSELLNDFRSILRWLLDVCQERSAINQAICDIVDSRTHEFAKFAYVGYTATPYANFLNERQGADNPLELDFAQSMQLSPEYFGLAKIFGEDVTDNARMPIVHEVAEDKKDAIDKLNNPSYESPLEVAIQWAFCCAALRRAYRIGQGVADDDVSNRDRLVTTMLINVSRKQTDHRAQSEAIGRYLDSKLRDEAQRKAFKESCLNTFDSLSKDLNADQFKKEFAYEIGQGVFTSVRDLFRQDVAQNIDYFFDRFKVAVLNSNVENQPVYSEYADSRLGGDLLWIIIGGNRISRGLTFHGLVATYFDRESPTLTVETLTQMGRWFGYRPGYELMPRVWMPTGSVKTLKEICRLEEDLHTQIGQMFAAGDSRPNPLMKCISMRLTGRDAGAERSAGIENPISTNELYSDVDTARKSVEVVREFIKNLGQEWTREDGDQVDRVYAQLHRWHGVPANKVIDGLIKPMNVLLPVSSANRLKQAIDKIAANDWNIVLADPRNKEPTVRLEGIQVHINGASEWGSVASGVVRFGKFTGQYDAWRAVAPVGYVQEVEGGVGNRRVNTQEAWDLLFEKMSKDENCAADAQRPILQIGFLPIGKEKKPSAYISMFWPGHDKICDATIGRGNVFDNVRVQTPPAKVVSMVPSPDSGIEYSCIGHGKQDNGLTEEQKKCIGDVLDALACLDCPWYKGVDLKEAINGVVTGISQRWNLALSYVLEHGWMRIQSDQRNGDIYFPTTFAQNGEEAISKIKKSFLSAVKNALVVCAQVNEGIVAGDRLWETAQRKWNDEHNGMFKQKIDRVITKNNVLPAQRCPTANVDDALRCLKEYGICCREENRRYYYSLE